MIWDATNGAHVRTLEGHTEGVNDIAWSSDPMYLASGSDDYSVRIWNIQRVRIFHSCPIGRFLTPSIDREFVSRPLQGMQTTSSVSILIPTEICWPAGVMMKQYRSGTSYKVIHATKVPSNYLINPLQAVSGSRQTPKNHSCTLGPCNSRQFQQRWNLSCIKLI